MPMHLGETLPPDPTESPTSEPSSPATPSTSPTSSAPLTPVEPSCGTSANPCVVDPIWPAGVVAPAATAVALVLVLLAALLFAQLRRP